MSGKPRILVVDDDHYQHVLLGLELGDDFEVASAGSGEEGLALARKNPPALVLMDISMPGGSGYDACAAMKQDERLAEIPVIFLSALTELGDRIAAYESGAEDFIGKPFAPTELRNKVSVTLRNVAERKRLEEQGKTAFSAAMTAMATLGEVGVVLGCLRDSLACGDYASLAAVCLQAVSSYGLHASVQIRGKEGCVSRNEAGEVSALEANVLSALENSERIYDFNQRTAFNFAHVTLLVRNMPLDDPDRNGRMRDNLALLGEAIDARVKAMDAELALIAQRQTTLRLVDNARRALTDIEQRHQRQKVRATTIMHDMLQQTEVTFYTLGLTEVQEEKVISNLNGAMTKILELYEEGLAIESHVKAVMSEVMAVNREDAG